MQNTCSSHQEVSLAICLNKQCIPNLLCLRCIQDHTKEHNSDTIELFKLEKDDKWLETHEKQKEELTSKINSIFTEREAIMTQYKDLFTGSLEEIMKNEEFSKLEKDLQSLKDFNFREGDLYTKINKVKEFYQDLSMTTDHVGNLQSSLDKIKLSDNELSNKKEDLISLLRKFIYGDSIVKETSKEEKELNSLKEEYKKFKLDTEKRIKALQKENNDLKAKNKLAEANNKNEVPKKENEVQKKENEAPKPKIEKAPEAKNNGKENENVSVVEKGKEDARKVNDASEKREAENNQDANKHKDKENNQPKVQANQGKNQAKAAKAEKQPALAKVESKKQIVNEADAAALVKEN